MKCSVCKIVGHNKRTCKISVLTSTVDVNTGVSRKKRIIKRRKVSTNICEQEVKTTRVNNKTLITSAKTDVDVESRIKVDMEYTDSIHNMLIRIIQQQKQKEEEHDIWMNSPYKDLVKLQNNNVGNEAVENIFWIYPHANPIQVYSF